MAKIGRMRKARYKYLKLNAVQCNRCRRVLVSMHRNDFAECGCGQFTDGGFDYVHRSMDVMPVGMYLRKVV